MLKSGSRAFGELGADLLDFGGATERHEVTTRLVDRVLSVLQTQHLQEMADRRRADSVEPAPATHTGHRGGWCVGVCSFTSLVDRGWAFLVFGAFPFQMVFCRDSARSFLQIETDRA